jgi:site-specific recombinase XerD
MAKAVTADPVDLDAGMSSLAWQSRRSYRRWILRYLADTYQIDRRKFNLSNLRAEILTASLTPQHLKRWLTHLQARQLSVATLTQARCAILWLAQHMAEQEHTNLLTPAALSRVRIPKACDSPGRRTWLNREQIQAVLKAVAVEEKPALRARNTAILVLMVTCGLRRAEVAAAQWRDLVEREGQSILAVHGKARKERIITLSSMAVEAIAAWRPFHPMPHGAHFIFTAIKPNGEVTSEGLSGQAIFNIVQAAGENAGLRISPHDLRRSFALGAFEAGADYESIRATLGHVSAGTTQRYIGSHHREADAVQHFTESLED